MVVMEVVVDTFFWETKDFGPCFILNLHRHIKAGHGGDGAENTGADGADKFMRCH
jgi:hypothetical protein